MPGPCANHPSVPATVVCKGCGLEFCGDCTVEISGAPHCGRCKNRAVVDILSEVEFKLPREALIYAVAAIFCCGPILAPLAIIKGSSALQKIGKNPALPGKGMAIAAIIMGSLLSILWMIQIAMILSKM